MRSRDSTNAGNERLVSEKLRLLVVEDNDNDYQLLLAELKRALIDHSATRVETRKDFEQNLREFKPDLIISDYVLPRFNGMEALRIAQEFDAMVPLIITTGSMNEETAVECIKAGAADYVLKEHLTRIGSAVKGALERKKQKEENEKIQKELRKFSIAVEQTADNILITDRDGIIQYVNPAFEKMTGYTGKEILGKTPQILKSGKQDAAFYATLWETIASGRTFRDVFINRKKSGELYYEEQTITPLVDDAGKTTHFVSVGTDVTEQRRAEVALRLAEENYRSIFENAIDGIFQTTPEGRFLVANPAMARILGYASQQELAQLITDIRQLYVKDEHWTEFQRLMKQESTVFGFETQFHRRDGRVIWVLLNVRAVRDVTGTPLRYEGTIKEITERKQAEQEVRLLPALVKAIAISVIVMSIYEYAIDEFTNSLGLGESIFRIFTAVGITAGAVLFALRKQRILHRQALSAITERRHAEEELKTTAGQLKNLFDNLDEVFYSFDPVNNKLLQISRASEHIYGYSQDEFLKNPDFWFKLIDQKDQPRVEAAYSQLLKGIPKQWECRIVRRDGEIRWIDTKSKPALGESGKVIRIDGIVTDITDRKRAEEVLYESERRFREMLGNVELIAITLDKKGVITFANDYLLRLTGRTREETIGADWFSMFLPDGDPKVKKEFLDSLAAGTIPAHYENPIITKKGERRDIRWNNTVLRDAGGNIMGTASIAEDVTDRKKTIESLQKSENEMRALFEAMNDVVMVLDKGGRYVKIAPTDPEFPYKSPPELLGKTIHEVLPSEKADEILRDIRLTLDSGKPHAIEYSLPMKGMEIWFEGNVSPLNENEVVWVAHDITEQKHARQQLAESEERFRSFYEFSPIGIVALASDGRFLRGNPALRKMFGYEEDELLKMKFNDLTYPEDKMIGSQAFEQLKNGSRDIISLQKRYITKAGKLVWASVTAAALRDDAGNFLQTVSAIQNITERIESEKRIREQADLLDKAHESISVRDLEGTTLYWNKGSEVLYGWTKEEVIGKNAFELLRMEPEETVQQAKTIVLEKGEWKGELHHRTKDDRVVIVEGLWSLVRNDQGVATSILVINTDITERKVLRQELIQAQKMESLGTLAGGIAHDFNNILGIIMAHSTLAEHTKLPQSQIIQSIHAITKATERGAGLVRQLLTFARKTDVKFESVRINETVREVLKLLSQALPKSIEITTDLAESLPSIIADATQMHQVLVNLCINARDAMPKGGTLSISTSLASGNSARQKFPSADAFDYVKLSVSDTGIGMDEATKARIFDPFFTTKEVGKGTGLGLATVFGIIKAHNGFIEVESRLEQGTTFVLWFPMQPKSLEPVSVTTGNIEEIPGGTETILLIEDEDELRKVASWTLRQKGYNVIEAQDGSEGVRLYTEDREKISLVITDLGLPKLDGSIVLSTIKNINPKVRVIIASGFVEPSVKSELLKAGANEFLQKPYLADKLLTLVRKVLDAGRKSVA